MNLATKWAIFTGLLIFALLVFLSFFLLYQKNQKLLNTKPNYVNSLSYKIRNAFIFALVIIALASVILAITILIF